MVTLRVPLVLVLFTVPVLAGCLNRAADDVSPSELVPIDAGWLPKIFTGYIHESVDVTAEGGLGGLEVHLDLWRPDPATFTGADASGKDAPVPVIVDMGPYFGEIKQGGDRRTPHHVHEFIFEHMIPRGYAFAAVETPGSAGSTGCWDFMGPQETAAAAAAVDWLGGQEWSSGKVGMIGKSYDAMTQIMALSKHPEALATAVPIAPLTHAYGGLHMNGVPYLFVWGGAHAIYSAVFGVADVPVHTPERVENSILRKPDEAACAPDNFANGLGNLGDYNDYYKTRDFRATAREITVPLFYVQGFMDKNVKPDNAFPYVNDLSGPKLVWLGQWRHDYPNAEFAGRDDMYVTFTRWFDHWLKDVPNGIDGELGFVVQDSEGRWRRETSWPAADATPRTFRLADGALAGPDASGAGARFIDDGYAYWAAGQHRPTNEGLPAYLLYWGEPAEEDLHVGGPVSVTLSVASSGPRGNVMVELLDCPEAPSSECDLVTVGAMSLVHRNGLERSEPLTPGETVTVTFTLQPRDYVFAKGRVPAVVVAGSDTDWFQPEPTRNLITISESGEAPSEVVLPLIARGPETTMFVGCGSWLKEKACYRDGLEDRFPDDTL